MVSTFSINLEVQFQCSLIDEAMFDGARPQHVGSGKNPMEGPSQERDT